MISSIISSKVIPYSACRCKRDTTRRDVASFSMGVPVVTGRVVVTHSITAGAPTLISKAVGIAPIDRGSRLGPRPHVSGPSSGRPAAMPASSRTSMARTAFLAHAASLIARRLRADPGRKATAARACKADGRADRDQPRGVCFVRVSHSFNFVPVNLVFQRVNSCFLPIEAPEMEQLELSILCRLDAPGVVRPSEIRACKSYRDAVRLCWQLRRVRNMTRRSLAEEAGLYAPHVSCYLNDNERSRDLPGAAVKAFERVCGNTAISQWHGLNSKLTCLEEMQFQARAAA